ncbi:MAG: zinc ribbon domain-containing protein [Candidatus Gastranaerophilaceae bacterium]
MKCPVCKKNIPQSALKCPYCKTRTGLLCGHCNTVNPVGTLVCQKCGSELLKLCPRCHSVNFPIASKCRKCGAPLSNLNKKNLSNKTNNLADAFQPKLLTMEQGAETLIEGLRSKDKKIFSITGDKGAGKSTLLKKVIKDTERERLEWCVGKCTQLTQLTPGGVVQDMLLTLFKLPSFYANNSELQNEAIKFFTSEFRFLNNKEISDFLNFLYNSKDGNYEDIIINKKHTFEILGKIFDAFAHTGRFVFVIDNFDFIDGFSLEFFTNFIKQPSNRKFLKFIAIYNEQKPISAFFGVENTQLKEYLDINLAPASDKELAKIFAQTAEFVTDREKEIIFSRCNGNPAFVEQALSYSLDCQILDKAFIMPNSFNELIQERLSTLKKTNKEAHKMLCGAAILGDKLNLALLKEIFGYKNKEFNDIMSYLVKTKFIRPYNEIYYEFSNLFLWETILKNIEKDISFEDLNVKVGKAISIFNINTNAIMAMIAHNLKENRMAFDIWTKTTRLASYVGDINLYVIAQKQCLALLNEFNENETLNIRYNISERLGKLLTEYDPEEALEFLPDAISNARAQNNEEKEIELLGYLALCCKKSGNYFGDVECVDNVLKKMTTGQELETALIKSAKLSSLIAIGNSGEVINLIDNDILPTLNAHLTKPRLDKTIPLGFVYDTWLLVNLHLSAALAIQGNDRSFEILTMLFEVIEKQHITDLNLICKANLVLALANTLKGNFSTSKEILTDIVGRYGEQLNDKYDIVNDYNLISIINKVLQRDYSDIQEDLFECVKFANDTGNEFAKHIYKTFLGKLFCDLQQAKRAVNIYNEEVSWFAEKKMALGALLAWYLIAEATVITESVKNSIDIALKALEIAQNPRINNTFFIVLLKMQLAKAYIELSDYETAKIHLETAATLAKKYNMNDLLSKIYLTFGKYYQELGSVQSQQQTDYLKGAAKMLDNAMTIVVEKTKNNFIKEQITQQKNILTTYCQTNGFNI